MRNNFDLLRLLFAAGVFVVHLGELPGRFYDARAFGIDSALCVYGFFAISGYLITASLERSPTLAIYFGKRARRLAPAYIAVIAFGVLLGALFTTLSLADYFTSPRTGNYLLWNLLLLNQLQPTLPGVFADNPVPAVNGALWSIRIEVACYLLLPLWLVLARRLGAILLTAVGLIALLAAGVALTEVEPAGGSVLYEQIRVGLLVPFGCFLTGSLLWLWRGWKSRVGLGAVLAAIAFAVTRVLPPSFATLWLGIVPFTLLVIAGGVSLPYLGNWGRCGDLSYGLYIYHFPVIQAVIATGLFATHPVPAALLTVVLVVALAFLSWHCIEKPFLLRGSHYRQAEQPLLSSASSAERNEAAPSIFA